MSEFDYGRLARSAKRLIERFGGPIDIVTTNATVNPTQSWKAGVAEPATEPGTGVFTSYEQKFIDGTLIRQGDQKVLVSALGLVFKPDFIGYLIRKLPGGINEKWTIVKIKPLNPGDTVVIYIIQVRQ